MRRACLPSSFARRQRGVTMVESLMAATLGVLVLALGTTSVLTLAANEQHSAGARAVVASLELARTAAIARRVPVAVCGIDERGAERPLHEVRCTVEAQPWTRGWVVFEDSNRNGRIDAGEAVLHVEPARRIDVRASAVAQDTPLVAVSFNPVGTLGHATPVVLAIASSAGETSRSVCVTTDGLARIRAPQSRCG